MFILHVRILHSRITEYLESNSRERWQVIACLLSIKPGIYFLLEKN